MAQVDFPHPSVRYTANLFGLRLYDDWQDKTIFTLAGPVTDGIQHNIVIAVDPDLPMESLVDYADWQIRALEEELRACRLLKKEKIRLANGMPAYKAIFSWYPTDDLRVYQEHIYLLVSKTGFKLAATFTKKTRKTLGPLVERMMLSFMPQIEGQGPTKQGVQSDSQSIRRNSYDR